LHFKRKLGKLLYRRRLSTVEQWWHVANAAILPLLISSVEEPQYDVVDNLVRWALENCANNYAQFSKDFKTLKKQMRKHFAIEGSLDTFKCKPAMLPYVKSCNLKQDFDGPASYGRYILLWTQTRATGLADSVMIRESIDKFVNTIETPSSKVSINPAVLLETLQGARDAKASLAVVSVGTTACLEKTREAGGKTAQLQELSRKKVLRSQYNWETLEETVIAPRAVRTSRDVVDWAIQSALHRPTHTRCVRVHAVAEPGKARTITVAPYSYQVLMGVFAHVYQATLKSKGVQSGLRADRHLWRFLQQNLNPQSENWEKLDEGQVFALSTDLSEATDFGNKEFSKRILDYMIRMVPGMPLALSVLVKTLYCSNRYIFVPVGGGNFSLHIATRSWFMGDMMTKFMLTAAHDYCCRLSGLQVYTLVGDDEIALSSNPGELYRHLDTLKRFFRVSEDDTFVSGHFAFYCEEGTLLPQRVSELNHVRMRRGKELLYLDYPRIRLLLPIKMETDLYSSTNQGRFALLGKEARWVDSVNTEAKRNFTLASLYQHILLQQDRDCLCPFTPLEMGGDGGFPHSWTFLRKVVDDKCYNPREAKYRMASLLNNAFNHKFLRSDRLDRVVHKHHLYLPKLEGLKALLPPESLLIPNSDEASIMLRSMRFRDIEKPQNTFLRLCRGLYYQALLQGKDPVVPVFNIDRAYSGGFSDPEVDFLSFIEKWKNPGFNFQNIDTYFVRKSMVPGMDPMNLGLVDESPDKYPSSRDLFNDWAERNISFEETSLPAILAMIKDKEPLPPRVVQRLNLFLESDAYILHMLPTKPKKVIGLVTRDIKLGVKVLYAVNGRDPDNYHYVVCLDPAIYMVGRTEELSGVLLDLRQRIPEDIEWITDPGSMLHVDYNEFTDGFPHREDIWDANIRILETRTEYVYRAIM